MADKIRFRIYIDYKYYISVYVYDTVLAMHRDSKRIQGEKADPGETSMVIWPGDYNGCICYMLFTWRFVQPHVVAHEAHHAAWKCCLKFGRAIDANAEEHIARLIEKITREILQELAFRDKNWSYLK